MTYLPKKLLAGAAALLAVAFLGGCGPKHKVVNLVTASKGKIKFGYVQASTLQQGIIMCDAGAGDGALTNCGEMQIVFEE